MNPIKDLRTKANLSRDELAELLGCSKRMIEAIELNERNPSIRLAVKMKNLFGCSLDDIYRNIIEKQIIFQKQAEYIGQI